MGLISEFKTFINRGNVMDLAVGVIIGGAFATITKSLTDDLIMPVVGRIIGKLDFSNLFVVLSEPPAGVPHTLDALKKAGVPVFAYGNFLTILVNFIILAFIIFMMVRAIMKMRAAEPPPAPAATPEDVVLLREIRDSLKARQP